MRSIAFRLALTAAAASALIAGCTATDHQHGASPTATAAAVTVRDLLSAPVPELCRHEPGALVDGQLPHQDSAPGHVGIAEKPKPDTGYWMVLGDVTGDGVDDGALVTACDAGGAHSWPATVQLYSAGRTWLGGVDLGELTHGGNEVVTVLSIANGMVHVSWVTQGSHAAPCCGPGHMTGDLRWDGSKVLVENIKRTS